MARHRMSELRRSRHRREPKRRFYIFCEGKKTEPSYFAALKAAWPNALVEVNTFPGAGVPNTIAAAASNLARSLGLSPRSQKPQSSFEENDEIWAVFDRDEHPNFNGAIDRCHRAGVRIGRSNPCFELWLILHEEDFDRPDSRHAVQIRLKKLRPEYDRHGAKIPDCTDLVTRSQTAEDRANKQLNRREEEGAPFGQPSTTVGQLTHAIRNAAEKAT